MSFLMENDARWVSYKYDPDTEDVFLARTLDAGLKRDDFAVVPSMSRYKMCLVQIWDVDIAEKQILQSTYRRVGDHRIYPWGSNKGPNTWEGGEACWVYGVFDRSKFDQAVMHQEKVLEMFSGNAS